MTIKTIADFWFDPSCPYTWITSRWLVEVERVRPVEVRWHVMSLSVLNEGRDEDPEGDTEGYLWVPVRVCMAVLQEYGQEALGRLYTAMWTEGVPAGRTGPVPCTTPWSPPACRRSWPRPGCRRPTTRRYAPAHAEGIGLIGEHVGTPVVAANGPATGGERVVFFGPVISRIPAGERAGRLWDGTLLRPTRASTSSRGPRTRSPGSTTRADGPYGRPPSTPWPGRRVHRHPGAGGPGAGYEGFV